MDEIEKSIENLDIMVEQIVQMEHDFALNIRKQVAEQWLEDCLKQNSTNEE